MAEGLFDNYAAPVAILLGHQANLGKPFDDVTEVVGRGGEIEEKIAMVAMFVIDFGQGIFKACVGGGIVEVSVDVSHAAHKIAPDILVDGATGKLFEVFCQFLAGILVAHRAAANANDGKIGRQELLAGEVVESGNQFAAGE